MHIIILPGNTTNADQFAKYLSRHGHIVTIDPTAEHPYINGSKVHPFAYDKMEILAEMYVAFEQEKSTSTFTLQAKTGALEHQIAWTPERGLDCSVTRVEQIDRVCDTTTDQLRKFAAALVDFCDLVEGAGK